VNVEEILRNSINAPSGSNSQPWKFLVKGSEIYILAFPENDHPILNYRSRGTWIAHGALIENIIIAASKYAYKATPMIFPYDPKTHIIAKIKLEKSEDIAVNPLFEILSKRTTNRKIYKKEKLNEDQKNAIIGTIGGNNNIVFKLIEDREKINKIGNAVSANEIVTLENKKLHKLFFNEVIWTEKENKKNPKGIFLKTMEFKPPQKLVFKLLRNWNVMKIANKIKFARIIAKGNGKGYASCAAMGVIAVDNNDNDFIEAGRILERMWLEATKMNLSFHLITGIFFYWQAIKLGNSNILNKEHQEIIENAYKETEESSGINDKIITIVCRIGKDGEPTGISTKLPPDIEYIS